ncbi:RidA family protein [Kineococcus radiotolerans]|uniref:RidA family protein n=1 Tax=Kineococcus radiotolerans TaxID=131568 RepID=UPI001C8550B6
MPVQPREPSVTVQLSSPESLMQPVPYAHVAIGTGTRHVHVAGQISRDAQGRALAPGDLAGQVAHALRNTGAGLRSAGAGFGDVVRLTFYVTDWSPEKIEAFMAGVQEVAEELGLPQPMPPSSLIGVDHLFEPDVLVEVEATAVTG